MLKYNPTMHRRRSIRLKGYDYSLAGLYFITICCDGQICRFGNIQNNEIDLNEYGHIAYNQWVGLTTRFQNMELDDFQIMPNHIHAIIALNNHGSETTTDISKSAIVGAGLAPAQNAPTQNAPAQKQNDTTISPIGDIGAGASPAPTGVSIATISDIVGAYKSLVANDCLQIYKSKNATMGKLWQRNYYEHIIRNEQSYRNISDYIINNPTNWQEDKFYQQWQQ